MVVPREIIETEIAEAHVRSAVPKHVLSRARVAQNFAHHRRTHAFDLRAEPIPALFDRKSAPNQVGYLVLEGIKSILTNELIDHILFVAPA
jgi:hypothetical protein